MGRVGIKVVGDIIAMDRGKLQLEFGSYTQRLYELAHGIEHMRDAVLRYLVPVLSQTKTALPRSRQFHT